MKLFILNIERLKKYVSVLFTFVLIGLMVHSCKKPTVKLESFQASNLRVINGVPGTNDVKLYLDTFNLTYTKTVDYVGVLPYYVVYSGSRHAALFSKSTLDTFARASILLVPEKNYTLFFAGSLGKVKPIFTEDDLSQPDPDKAKIRLANLSENAGNIYLTIQLRSTTPQSESIVLQNVSAESISNYKIVNVPASKGNFTPNIYMIRVYETGTANLLATIKDVDIRGTSTHTIIVTGEKNGPAGLTATHAMEWLDF